jgi:hypothetical protein
LERDTFFQSQFSLSWNVAGARVEKNGRSKQRPYKPKAIQKSGYNFSGKGRVEQAGVYSGAVIVESQICDSPGD